MGGRSEMVEQTFGRYLGASAAKFFFLNIAIISWLYNKHLIADIKIQSATGKNTIQRELNFLRSQFNSHLTFNFFNYCYCRIQHSPIAAMAVEDFTDILRHSLHNKNYKIPLQAELDYITKFLSIHNLLTKKLNIDLRIKGESNYKCIVSGILPTVIDKTIAFSDYSKSKIYINIELNIDEKQLECKISSKIPLLLDKKGLKIFTDEIQKIIQLFYRNNHIFINNDKCYQCYLSLSELDNYYLNH